MTWWWIIVLVAWSIFGLSGVGTMIYIAVWRYRNPRKAAENDAKEYQRRERKRTERYERERQRDGLA